MAKPNYRFDKRQRELSRQKKKEEKRLKKEARQTASPETPVAESTSTQQDQ